jgi:hypothetical protein
MNRVLEFPWEMLNTHSESVPLHIVRCVFSFEGDPREEIRLLSPGRRFGISSDTLRVTEETESLA